jgi:hypothetical protein
LKFIMVNQDSVDPARGGQKPSVNLLDTWLYELKLKTDKLACDLASATLLIAQKDQTIADLTARIEKLEKKPSTPLQFSEIASQLGKAGSTTNVALVKAVTANAKSTVSKAKQVLFVGIPVPNSGSVQVTSDSDLQTIEAVVNSLNIKAKIVSSKRITRSNPESDYSPVIVEFENSETRNSILAAAKNLSGTEYKNVYIRPDRTIVEQATFKKLYTERKEKNDILAANGTLDSPFRCVIRNDTVRCIDVSKTVTIRSIDRHPFCEWDKAKLQRNNNSSSTTTPTDA